MSDSDFSQPLAPILSGAGATPPFISPNASGPMPAPSPATPPSAAMLPGMQSPDVTPPQQINPATPPPAPDGAGGSTPSVWQRVLQGALWGLSGVDTNGKRPGFFTGLVQGVRGNQEMQIAQKEQQLKLQAQQQALQFQSAQAADSHRKALNEARQADLAAQETQGVIDAQHRAALDWNLAHGLAPDMTLSASGPSDMHQQAISALPVLAKANSNGTNPNTPDVIPGISITNSAQGVGTDNGNHEINVFTVTPRDILEHPNGVLNTINAARVAQGQSKFAGMNDALAYGAQVNKENPAAGVAALGQQAQQFLLSVPALDKRDGSPKAALENYDTDLTSFKQQVANYKRSPDFDAATGNLLDAKQAAWSAMSQELHDKFDANELHSGDIQAQIDANRKNAEANTPSGQLETRLKNAQLSKLSDSPVYAVNAQGQTVQATQSQVDANPGAYSAVRPVKESDISKDQKDIRVLNDISLKADQVRQSAAAMDSTSWGQAIGVAHYLENNPTSTSSSIVNAKVMQGLTPQARSYTINVLSLREAAMGLQKVLTGSARSNESQIKALQATIPGFESNSGVVGQKLAAFEQNLGMLAQGLPINTGVPLQVRSGSATPGTHVFDSQKWAAANPGKDVNAAIAAAKNQGYQVK